MDSASGIFLFLFIVVSLFCVLYVIFMNIEHQAQEAAQREAAAKARALEKALEEKERRSRQLEAAAIAAQAAEANANQLVVAAKKDVERARQEFAAGGKNLQELDESLREGQMLFQRLGKVLTVRVFVVPPTGRVGLQWIVMWDRPYPPLVKILFDNRSEDTEHSFQGSWVRTLKRGASYTFRLTVHDESRHSSDSLVDRLDLTVQVPTQKQWARTVNPPPPPPQLTDAEAESLELGEYRKVFDRFVAGVINRRQLLKTVKEKLFSSALDEGEEAMVMAQIEAWMAQEGQ